MSTEEGKNRSTDFFIRQWESVDKEEFKRSNHNDFATAVELKDRKFSGIRHNSITGDVEIWTDGDVRKRISALDAINNEFAIERAIEEVFAINKVELL